MKPELQGIFIRESRQLLAAMRRDLTSARDRPRALPDLFRRAHTLKGNAELAEFPELKMLVVPLADILRLAKQKDELSEGKASLVLKAVEACQALIEGRKVKNMLSLVSRLREAAEGLGARRAAESPVRILLVEDSDRQAANIQRTLAECTGAVFRVERRDRLAGALERLARGGLDVVLLDLNLPDSEGLQTIAKLTARFPASPVVVLTIVDNDVLAMEAVHQGAQDYVLKSGIDAQVLPRVIHYAIERKCIEESLRKARAELALRVEERTAELRKVNRELMLFASAAAHELREPVRKIVAWGDLLKEQYGESLGENGLKLLGEMQRAARRQSDIIDSLRDLTKVTTQSLPMEPVDLNAVIGDILADIAPRWTEAGGRVEVERLPTLKADKLQMRQLFQNLLANAFKYRKKDQPPLVAIRVRERRGGMAEITVEDNGIGFEQEYAQKIFQPFERLHGQREYEGVGMGLAICARIVARHGGDISARSEPGKGSIFTVILPTAQDAQ